MRREKGLGVFWAVMVFFGLCVGRGVRGEVPLSGAGEEVPSKMVKTTIPRSFLREVLAKKEELFGEARFFPVYGKNKKPKGLKIAAFREGSRLRQLGFHEKDILLLVEGMSVLERAKIWAWLSSHWRKAEKIETLLLREGKRYRHFLLIKDDKGDYEPLPNLASGIAGVAVTMPSLSEKELEGLLLKIRVLPKGNVAIPSALWDRVRMNQVLGKVGVVPHLEGEKAVGVRLLRVSRSSIVERVGLRDGDIVLSANGILLREMKSIFLVMETLRKKPFLKLKVRRGKDILYFHLYRG